MVISSADGTPQCQDYIGESTLVKWSSHEFRRWGTSISKMHGKVKHQGGGQTLGKIPDNCQMSKVVNLFREFSLRPIASGQASQRPAAQRAAWGLPRERFNGYGSTL